MKRKVQDHKLTQQTQSVNFDVWIQRFANISQVVITIATLASLYFIVIPIYQNQLLSESIAKKEVELNDIQKQFDKTSIELQSLQQQLDQYYRKIVSQEVNNFLSKTNLKCTGLLNPVDLAQSTESNKFEIDVLKCWEDEFASFNFGSLKNSEKFELERDLQVMLSKFMIERTRLKNQYDKVGFSVASDDFKHGPFTKYIEGEIKKYDPDGIAEQKILRVAAYYSAKRDVEQNYIRIQIDAVNQLKEKWNIENPNFQTRP